MGELVTANDVARGVNMFSGRSQSIVNLDPFLRVVHTSFLEVESHQMRPAAGRDERHLASRFLPTCGDHDRFPIFVRSSGTPPYKTDAFAFENLLQQLTNFRVLFWQQEVCYDYDLATEPLISLRNLGGKWGRLRQRSSSGADTCSRRCAGK